MLNRKYHLFDATDKVLGRMATEIVKVLRGKNKVDFAPHIDGGDFVVVINANKIKVAFGKGEKKIYYHFSGYPGGISAINLADRLKKDSRKVVRDAVYGMLPKNKLRDRMLGRLLIYPDDKHTHTINGESN